MAFVAPKARCPSLFPHSKQEFWPLKNLFFPCMGGISSISQSVSAEKHSVTDFQVLLEMEHGALLPWQPGDAPTGTIAHCGLSLLGLGSLERRKTLTSEWRRTLIRLSSEKEKPETKLHKLYFKNCISMLSALPPSALPLRETGQVELRNSKWSIGYVFFIYWLLIALKDCFRDIWIFQSRCQRLMSLKLEVLTGFAVGCKQEEGKEQAGGAKLGSFLVWLYWENFCAAPGLLCSPHCPVLSSAVRAPSTANRV